MSEAMHKVFERMDWSSLVAEYGVRGKRLLPWQGVTPPFGGAWVVVAPHSVSLDHANEPRDEEELFICISGQATACIGESRRELKAGDIAYLAPGVRHWLENSHDSECHLYCLWWNQHSIEASLQARKEAA